MFGDGFATGHIWPEWADIVDALYPDIECVNVSAIGAGPEFIVDNIIAEHTKSPDAWFLVQWPEPHRFDKLIEDDSWDRIINADSVYNFNRVTANDKSWWISSASRHPDIAKYHRHFIQHNQARSRLVNAVYLTANLLKNQSTFFLTSIAKFTQKEKTILSTAPWSWHEPWSGMLEFGKLPEFANTIQKYPQPDPIVHFAYVEQIILPTIPARPDENRIKELKKRIHEHKWQAYDPERAEIWARIKDF